MSLQSVIGGEQSDPRLTVHSAKVERETETERGRETHELRGPLFCLSGPVTVSPYTPPLSLSLPLVLSLATRCAGAKPRYTLSPV